MGLGKEGQVEPLNPNIMVGTSFPPSETGAAPGYRCFVGTPVPEAPVSSGGEFTP